MSEELETSILKADSIEEAQRLSNATGKVVEYEMLLPNAQLFQPSLDFFKILRLRLWLLRKRTCWFLQKTMRIYPAAADKSGGKNGGSTNKYGSFER